jgi:hypothetical protein
MLPSGELEEEFPGELLLKPARYQSVPRRAAVRIAGSGREWRLGAGESWRMRQTLSKR